MKWYTCTPVPFKGDHTFFSRDSGAFCKAFQRIGLESRAIMPTPVQEGDDPDLIRTEYANLDIVRKLALIPNPISSTCRYAGEKRNIIMAVGRWDDLLYKRPFLLMATLEQALPRAPHWEAEIYGNIPPLLREWHGNLPEDLRARIRLAGYLPNAELQKKYSQARISLCTSRSEGTHVASAEALCAGASVVGPRLTPLLNCLQWYVSHDSGTLSPKDTPESVSGALLEEIRAWDEGKRSPEEISRYWCSLLHAENSCKRIIAAYEAAKGGS